MKKREKNNRKKWITLMLSLTLAFACFLPSMSAQAGGWTNIKYKKSITLTQQYIPYVVDMGSKGKAMKNLKVTTSNKKVIAVNLNGVAKDAVILYPGKPGKATVTIKFKYKNKKYTYKMKIKMVKYKNPIKSFKVGSKNAASKFKKTYCPEYKVTPSKQKIKVTPKKGWKIKAIYHNYYEFKEQAGTDELLAEKKSVKIKNNSSIQIPNNTNWLTVSLYNKKLNQYTEVILNLRTW